MSKKCYSLIAMICGILSIVIPFLTNIKLGNTVAAVISFVALALGAFAVVFGIILRKKNVDYSFVTTAILTGSIGAFLAACTASCAVCHIVIMA